MQKTRKKQTGPAGRKKTAASADRAIVLVGLMGAGKTTVGKRLAKALGLEFVDSDHEIEKAAGMTVAEIFETYGEGEFRALERRVIARLLDGSPQVIATGGGAFINNDTRALIKKEGLSVWLDAEVAVLVERTARKDTRPLLKAGDPEEILSRLAQERNPFYAEADLKVISADGPHDEVVHSILKAIKQHRKTGHRKHHAKP